MPIAEVLSQKVLHSYRIFAIIEQSLRLPSGRTVARQAAGSARRHVGIDQ